MWSFEEPKFSAPRQPRATSARGLIAIFALSAVVVSGCGDGGFRPLYGVTASGAHLDDRLLRVEYGTIPGRVGQRIRNELVFQGMGGGNPLPPEYRLEVITSETLTSTLVSSSGESQSQIYAVDARFRLIKIKDKAVVLEGNSHARAGFERFESVFANVRAREDAENRSARTIAGDLKTRLAAYLATAA